MVDLTNILDKSLEECKSQIYKNERKTSNHEITLAQHELRITELEEQENIFKTEMIELRKRDETRAIEISKILTIFKIIAFIVSTIAIPISLVVVNYMIGNYFVK